MQGRNGVARTCDGQRFQEQARCLLHWERVKRETLLKQAVRTARGKEIVEENAKRSGNQEGEHGWKCALFVADEPAGINDREWNRQADVHKQGGDMEPIIRDEQSSSERSQFDSQAIVERQKIEVECFWMSGGGPIKHGGSKIFRANKQERGD